jgi:hypothetical protein
VAELVSIARLRNLSGYVALARPITESFQPGRSRKSSPLRDSCLLQAATLLERVRRKVECSRTSLGSLSEAVEVFEPQQLEAIIGELWAQAPPSRGVGKGYVRRLLTAVDGSGMAPPSPPYPHSLCRQFAPA